MKRETETLASPQIQQVNHEHLDFGSEGTVCKTRHQLQKLKIPQGRQILSLNVVIAVIDSMQIIKNFKID